MCPLSICITQVVSAVAFVDDTKATNREMFEATRGVEVSSLTLAYFLLIWKNPK